MNILELVTTDDTIVYDEGNETYTLNLWSHRVIVCIPSMYNSREYDYFTVKAETEYSRYNSPILQEFSYGYMYSEDSNPSYTSRERILREYGEYVEKAESILINWLYNDLPEVIKAGKRHPAYSALYQVYLDVVKDYKTDFLFIDTFWLAINNPNTFYFVARDSGTRIALEFNADSIQYDYRQGHQVYFWDGTELIKYAKKM